jgi:uncharacterized damage-inducible protein DinB
MYQGNYYQMMAQYNHWMNRKLYAICAEIPDAERKKDLGAFFKSLHSTLDHLLYGDKAWMGRFLNEPFKGVSGQDLYSDFGALRRERENMDELILDWSARLETDWLNRPFTYKSGIDGKTRTLPAWALVTHMFNHQTHHRGQATALMKQLGRDPGVTDIPWLPELNAVVSG